MRSKELSDTDLLVLSRTRPQALGLFYERHASGVRLLGPSGWRRHRVEHSDDAIIGKSADLLAPGDRADEFLATVASMPAQAHSNHPALVDQLRIG